MSGIAGIYHRNGAPADRALVSRMLGSMPYRGPDGASVWMSREVCLGHLSLRTTPEAYFETQPVVDEARGLAVVLDGRLDNREELEAILDINLNWRRIGDAQVLLLSYAKWGESCLDRLVGDFAFAIWDAGRKQLFCARDIVGTRPFYYYADADLLVLASEIHPILQCEAVPRDPNEGLIGEILTGTIASPDETVFAAVRKIPAATAMVVPAVGPIRSRRYWPGAIKELRYRSDQEYADHFLDLYEKVVRTHLRSPGRVGVRLSGGIDSGSIAAVSQSLRRTAQVQTAVESFSVVDETDPQDEGPLISAMNHHCGLGSHLTPIFHPPGGYYANQVRCYRDLPEYPNGVTVDGLKDLARQMGFRVWLTGYGGGEWFSGSLHHLLDVWRVASLGQFWQEFRKVQIGRELSRIGLLRFLLNNRWPNMKPMMTRRLPASFWLPPWISKEFARRVQLRARLWDTPRWNLNLPAAKADSVRRALSAGDVHLTELEERSDSRFGLEARHPLNDRRMVELALALPENQRRLSHRNAKFILRNAMAGLVPDLVRLRFGSPTGTHMLASALVKDVAAKSFESLTIAEHGWLEGAEVRRLFEELREATEPVNQNARKLLALWHICAIDMWAGVAMG